MYCSGHDRSMLLFLREYGSENQIKKCAEECAELIQALMKNKAGEENVDHIAEEIADVYITCRQMELHFDCCGKVVSEIKRKIRRQLERMGFDPDEVMRGDWDVV